VSKSIARDQEQQLTRFVFVAQKHFQSITTKPERVNNEHLDLDTVLPTLPFIYFVLPVLGAYGQSSWDLVYGNKSELTFTKETGQTINAFPMTGPEPW
jgi:hypothetical protein